MAIYMVQTAESKRVKIGFTVNVFDRMYKMQTDNHEALSLVRLLDGDKKWERVIQKIFQDKRIRGDWFRFDDQMHGSMPISDLSIVRPRNFRIPKSQAHEKTHGGIIRALGGPVLLAQSLGINVVNTTGHWRRRGIPSTYRMQVAELAAKQGLIISSADWSSYSTDAA